MSGADDRTLDPSQASPGGYRPRVKICGVRTVEEAALAAELGADLLGLNFYPESPRFVDEERAREIVDGVRERGASVLFAGVFVDVPPAEAAALGERVGLDLLQFHGDEPIDDVASVADRSLKAFRVRDRLDAETLEGWLGLGLWGLVVDSRHPTLYGGSGESWNFASMKDPAVASRLEGLRLLIAGGLSPDNIRAALDAAKPWGIDLCSGIEAAPGKKDPVRMRRLFEEIQHVESTSAA